jgi:hypothetical protein
VWWQDIAHTEPDSLEEESRGEPGLVCRRIGHETLVHDRATRRICFLNATATRVWELKSAGKSTQEIVATLCSDYAAPDEGEVRKDVEACQVELARLGLVGRLRQESREDTIDGT